MVSGHLQYFPALGVVLVLGDCAAVERQSLRTWTIIKLAPGCQFLFVAAHMPRDHPAHAWSLVLGRVLWRFRFPPRLLGEAEQDQHEGDENRPQEQTDRAEGNDST